MIRNFNSSDLEVLQELDALCFGRAWSEDLWLHEVGNSFFRVLDFGDGLGGFALGRHCFDEYELLKICVAPELRGQGLGQRLLREQIQMAKGAGVSRCFLEVRESNSSAISLYHLTGWKSIGVRRGYYSDGENALIMELLL